MKSAIFAAAIAVGVSGFAGSSHAEGSQVQLLREYQDPSQRRAVAPLSAGAAALAVVPSDRSSALVGVPGGPKTAPQNLGVATGPEVTEKSNRSNP